MNLETYQMPKASVLANEVNTKKDWLDPVFIAPRASHTRSLILLHGRGSNAYSFAMGLMSVRLSKATMNLAEVFPGTKFIFPTSKLRRAIAVNRAAIAQWFDIYTLKDPDSRQELQHEGLHDSAMFVHQIIQQEAKIVGLENVVLGGLSQGCALGLHVLMSFEGEPGRHLGGFFGMSGWLPFSKQLEAVSEDKDTGWKDADSQDTTDKDQGKDRHDDLFGNNDSIGHDDKGACARAAQFVRECVMDFAGTKISNDLPSVPIFLGHGEIDEKVSVSLGEDAARIMAKLGWNVTWKSYADLEHWYSREELEDIVSFVQGLGLGSKRKDE